MLGLTNNVRWERDSRVSYCILFCFLFAIWAYDGKLYEVSECWKIICVCVKKIINFDKEIKTGFCEIYSKNKSKHQKFDLKVRVFYIELNVSFCSWSNQPAVKDSHTLQCFSSCQITAIDSNVFTGIWMWQTTKK